MTNSGRYNSTFIYDVDPLVDLSRSVERLLEQGIPVVNMARGEYAGSPPQLMLDAATRAVKCGPYGYAPVDGLSELKQAVVSRMKRWYGLEFSTSEVLITGGAKQALHNAMEVMFREQQGAEAVILAPYWPSYLNMLDVYGATVRVLPPPNDPDDFVDLESLYQAIGPKTRLLILNSPDNPSGTIASQDTLTAVSGLLKKNPQLTLISDETYSAIRFDGQHQCILNIDNDLRDQVILVDSISKAYSTAGWRVGWSIASENLTREMTNVQVRSTFGASVPAQVGAAAALNDCDDYLKDLREALRIRHDQLLQNLRLMAGVEAIPSAGGYYLFPNVSELIQRAGMRSDVELANWMLLEARVAIAPGSAFGSPGHLRFCFAVDQSELDLAVRNLRSILMTDATI